MRLTAIVREPLVHFVLIGALLFGAAELRRSTTSAPENKTIAVDAHVRRQLADAWEAANGRAPSAAELDARVARHIDEEVLYREGVQRGLHRDDPRVRQRVAEKMAFVIKAQITLGPPGDRELRDYFDKHRDKYKKPALVDFVQVFVSGRDAAAEQRARELLEKLRAGADPNGLGDRFSGGRRYRGRKIADLAQSFGAEFVTGLAEQRPGEWTLRRSKHGLHLVQIEKSTPPKSPELAEVRLEVAKDWEADERAARFDRELAKLRESWTIRQ